MCRWQCSLAAIAAFILITPAVLAQQSIDSATITGRALDPAGGPIAAAAVTVRSGERNQVWTRVADEHGRFTFLYLPPGPYELMVEAPGFTRHVKPLSLTAGQAVDLPVTLALPGFSADVLVRNDAGLIDTRRTQAADTIQPREVDALPLNGRNFLDLALLAPGVSRTIQRSTERFAETSAVPGTGISIAGQRNLNNTFLLDGLSANDDAAGLVGISLGQDVIREFQVVTSGGVAEFGRASAGIVSIVTQSGANTRRGRVYGFVRHHRLDARNALATREDPLAQRQYGASFSGPARRDTTFWFLNAERTNLERTGVITIAADTAAAINRVLDARAYPGPRVESGEFPTGYDTTNLFGRIDHAVAAADRLALRYTFYDVRSENARNVGGLNAASRGTRLDNRDQTIALSSLTSLSASAVNELRAQAMRGRLAAPPNDLTGPAVNIAGVASFGTATFSPTARALDVYEVSDALTLQRGDHLVKAGGVLLHERLDVHFPGAVQGVYAFSSLGNFEAGRYINMQQAFGEPAQFQTNTNIGLFVQDEWRARPWLTVNTGVRYDVQLLESPVRTDVNNVSPRAGIAIAPGAGRTVIRASGGLYYDRIPLRALSNALQRDGVKYRVALLSFGQADAPVFPSVLHAFPSAVLTNITSIAPDIESGVGRQFNVQVERQIARSLAATVSVTHLTGRGIIMSRNVNAPTLTAAEAAARGVANLGRPDERVANNSQFQGIGRSAYNGLSLSLRASASVFGTARLSYTLSKAEDDAGNAFFSTPQDNADIGADYGRSDNDQRHRVSLSGSLDPIFGIDIAYLFAYTSAPPFNIQTGADRNGDTTVNDRPAGVGRNTGEGFDFASLDLRISRTFHVRGRHRIAAMVDAFNVFNRANYLIPNNIIGTGATPPASFGTPTAAADPRQVQVGITWTF